MFYKIIIWTVINIVHYDLWVDNTKYHHDMKNQIYDSARVDKEIILLNCIS